MIPHMFMPFGDSNNIKDTYKYLYHYTTIPAFNNMLKTSQIWFGYTKNMNDRSEVSGYLQNISNKIKATVPNHTAKKKEILELINKMEELSHSFVMCFSKLEDDAAQWERYGDNACGLCLKFDADALAKISEEYLYFMTDVIYSLEESPDDLEELLNYIDDNPTLNHEPIITSITELGLTSLYHKHPSFQSEQEVRVIKFLKSENEKYEYKETNVIKRMFIFDLEQHHVTFEDLIDGIIIGPRSQQSVEELAMYLESLGFHKLSKKIRKSDCPLR